MPDPGTGKRSLPPVAWAALAVVLAALIALFLVRTRRSTSEATEEGHAEANAPAEATFGSPAPATHAAPDAPTAAHDGRRLDRTERIDAAQRVLLLAAIAKTLADDRSRRAHERTFPAGAGGAPDAGFGFEMDYLRERFEEDVLPLLHECYVNARAEDPSLSADIDMRYTIEGDEALGGLITDVEIIDATLPEDASLTECARESLYALRLKAPKGRASVTMTQRFRFAHRDGGEE